MSRNFIDATGVNTSTKNVDDVYHLYTGEKLEPLTKYEIEAAFKLWLNTFNRESVDWEWRTYRVNRGCDWLRQARKGLNLSAATVAERLNVTRQAVHAMELAEETGALTLKNFQKAAAALNCEIRYSVRPVNDKFISVAVWNQIVPHALKSDTLQRCHPTRRTNQLALEARKLQKDPAFRKAMGWSRNS